MRQVLVILVVAVVAAAVAAYFYFQGGVPSPPTAEEAGAEAGTLTGFDIADSALRQVNLEDVDGDPMLGGMLYLSYGELAKSPRGGAYSGLADSRFQKIYSECGSDLCGGEIYPAVYRRWQDSGDEGYRDTLVSNPPALHDIGDADSAPLSYSVQSLGFEYALTQDGRVHSQIDGQLSAANDYMASLPGVTDPAWVRYGCQIQRAAASLHEAEGVDVEPDDTLLSTIDVIRNWVPRESVSLGTIADCGIALVDRYEQTGNQTYKEVAVEMLSMIAEDYSGFRGFTGTTDVAPASSLTDVALFAAMLHDSEVTVE